MNIHRARKLVRRNPSYMNALIILVQPKERMAGATAQMDHLWHLNSQEITHLIIPGIWTLRVPTQM